MPTLLVVDDEEGVRFSFRHVFEEDDVRVLTAATAAEGLEMLRTRQPDVVVLDLQLPDRSGLDIFREIRAHRPETAGHVHHRPRHDRDRHRGDEAGGVRLPASSRSNLDRLSQIIARAFEAARLMRVPALLPTEEEGADRIVGRSAGRCRRCARRSAASRRRTSTC